MLTDSNPKVERTSWGYGQCASHRSSRGTQGFVAHNWEGVDEAKPGCGHTLGFSEVRKLFTLPNVDGNLTLLGAMFLILTALILRMIFDSKLLQGGM